MGRCGRCGTGHSSCKLDAAGCEPLGREGPTKCPSQWEFQGDTLGNLLLLSLHSYPTVFPFDPCHDLENRKVEFAHYTDINLA